MKENNKASTDWVEVKRVEGDNGSESPFLFTFVALRNVHTGKLRIDVQIPNADALRFPEDLGVLLHSFGWGLAGLGMVLRGVSFPTWHGCCEVLWKVDYLLKID
jgi:hypothetical protein